jgi:sterol desaturase/sphingolipid hydroxylase (fatty acid hydroxylase superfamily)
VDAISTIPPPPSARRPYSAGGIALGAVTAALLLGALAVRSGVIFGLVALAAVFIPLEKVFALHPRKVLRKGWTTDVVHFVVNNLLTLVGVIVAVVFVGRALHAVIPERARDAIASWPFGVQFAIALAVAELCGYWGHRATHRIPVLWRFHKVHHSIEEMDWLAAAHLHPIDQAFTRSCVVLPLYALGFSRTTFGAYLIVATVLAIFVHANVRIRLPGIRWLIGTPEYHHWHHANDGGAGNKNYASMPVIDAIFGTLHLPRAWPDRYGIDEPQPEGYLRQLGWPFMSG